MGGLILIYLAIILATVVVFFPQMRRDQQNDLIKNQYKFGEGDRISLWPAWELINMVLMKNFNIEVDHQFVLLKNGRLTYQSMCVTNLNSHFEEMWMKTACKCSFCGNSIIYSMRIGYEESRDQFYNCSGFPISLEQYNCGILNPICEKCDEALRTGGVPHTRLYQIRSFLKKVFLPEPEIPDWLFQESEEDV